MKHDVEEHNITSNVYHTQLLLKKYLQCDRELHDTKSKLIENENELRDMKSKLIENEDELRDTKSKLIENENELHDTKSKLIENKNDLHDTKSKLSATTNKLVKFIDQRLEQQREEIIPLIHKSTEAISSKINNKLVTKSPEEMLERTRRDPTQPPIKTREREFEFTEFNSLTLQHHQAFYEKTLKHVCDNIGVGEIRSINDKCFFKLQLKKNPKQLHVYHHGDLELYRNTSTVYANDIAVLNQDGLLKYKLHVVEKIGHWHLINRKEMGKNLRLKHGDSGNENIEWEIFKNKNGEVIFCSTLQ